jgi:protein TonB
MRTYTLVFSILAHAIAVSVVVIAPLFATSDLPEPRRASAYIVMKPRTMVGPDARQKAAQTTDRPAPPPAPPIAIPQVSPVDIADVPFDVPSDLPLSSIPPGTFSGDIGIADPVAPPAPARTAPPRVRVGGTVRAPAKVTHVSPIYPQVARAAHVEGTVILEAVIDESGAVDAVHVLRSVPLLDAAAIDAVRRWRFTPTMLNGQPIPIVMTVTVTFTLR